MPDHDDQAQYPQLEQQLTGTVAQSTSPVVYGQSLNEEEVAWLRSHAIDDQRMAGVTRIRTLSDLPPEFAHWGPKVVPAYCFTWKSTGGDRVLQLRPDVPPISRDGQPIRYLFPKGSGSRIGIATGFEQHQHDPRLPVLLVEGTKQLLATASCLSPDAPIAAPFGIAGCWGWSLKDGDSSRPSPDMDHMALEGRDVLVAFDADLLKNYGVFDAAQRLKGHLTSEFLVRSVRFLQIPGNDKSGMDDLLGRIAPERRCAVLRNLIDSAIELPAKGPKKPPKDGSGFFDSNGSLLTRTLWEYLRQEHRLALAGDQSIAVYRNGVYYNGKSKWFDREVALVLGDHFRTEHLNNVHAYGVSELKTSGQVIPFRQDRMLLNFRNGLLDPLTGILHPHTPEYLTLIQWQFDWDAKATCPTFDGWLDQQLPGQGEALLEHSCQMLDQCNYPSYMIFLHGPTRSGKSTFLRILRALAGAPLSSNVSLHALSGKDGGAGRFAPSRLFGKVLNTFADLSAEDLGDLSVFKCLTGGDPIHAEYKGKDGFDLENMATLVFSANAVPAVSESSGAYMARVAPFHFANSFLGAEDPGLEQRMMKELPGIMRRLTEALMNRLKRGKPLPCDAEVVDTFAIASDKVRLFLSERTRPGDRSRNCIARSSLYEDFKEWSQEEQGSKNARVLGKQKFNARVRNAGVEEFKPISDGWRWNLLPADPETAVIHPSKPPSWAPGAAGGNGTNGHRPSSAVSGPGVAPPQNPGQHCDPAGSSTVTAVSPHSPLPRNEDGKNLGAEEWVKAAESGEPADRVIKVTEQVAAVLEQHRCGPSHPDASRLAHQALAGQGISRTQIALALDQLKAEDQADQQELLL